VLTTELVDGRDHVFVTLIGEVELDSLEEFLSSEAAGLRLRLAVTLDLRDRDDVLILPGTCVAAPTSHLR
jgi:hypothetical protein